MLIGDELWKYLEDRGVVRHEHPNGLMSCWQCAQIVATGKTKAELDKEWQQWIDEIKDEDLPDE